MGNETTAVSFPMEMGRLGNGTTHRASPTGLSWEMGPPTAEPRSFHRASPFPVEMETRSFISIGNETAMVSFLMEMGQPGFGNGQAQWVARFPSEMQPPRFHFLWKWSKWKWKHPLRFSIPVVSFP